MAALPLLCALAGAGLLLSASHASAQEPLPTQVGECAATTIAAIGSRLSDDPNFDSGVGVRYANGLGQVSYNRVQAVLDSQVGDPVRICLVTVPTDCPPGDNRGKVYDTTNLRTGAMWEMADSQHECGGA